MINIEKTNISSILALSFFIDNKIVIVTRVAVKLSAIDEKKKVNIQSIKSNFTFDILLGMILWAILINTCLSLK